MYTNNYKSIRYCAPTSMAIHLPNQTNKNTKFMNKNTIITWCEYKQTNKKKIIYEIYVKQSCD